MSSKLEQLIALIEPVVTTAVPGTTYYLGEKHVKTHALNPRVVWVPAKDTFGPSTANGRSPRSVRSWKRQVAAHVFANTHEQAELLVNAIAWGLHSASHGAYNVETAEWFAPEWLTKGLVCVLTFSFNSPVTEPAKTTAQANAAAFDLTTTVAGDGYLDAGES